MFCLSFVSAGLPVPICHFVCFYFTWIHVQGFVSQDVQLEAKDLLVDFMGMKVLSACHKCLLCGSEMSVFICLFFAPGSTILLLHSTLEDGGCSKTCRNDVNMFCGLSKVSQGSLQANVGLQVIQIAATTILLYCQQHFRQAEMVPTGVYTLQHTPVCMLGK